jgi:hypothetical protein
VDLRDVYVYTFQGSIYGSFIHFPAAKLASIEDVRQHPETWVGVLNVREGRFTHSNHHENYIPFN